MMLCLNLACDQRQNLDGSRFCQRCGHPLLTQIHEHFSIHTLLKTEPYTQIFRAKRSDDATNPQTDYLIRQINLQGPHEKYSPKAESYFQAEINKILKLPPNPGIVPIVDCIKQGHDFFLVRPYLKGPNLQQAPGTADYTEDGVRNMLLDLLQSLEFLHDHDCVHGALTPSHLFSQTGEDKFLIVGMAETLALEVAANYAKFSQWENPALSFAAAFRHPTRDLYRLSYICAQLLPTKILSDKKLHHVIAKMMNLSAGDRYQNASEILRDLGEVRTNSSIPDAVKHYQTVYHQSVKAQFPISAQVRHQLVALQGHLNLTPEDISAIESQVEKAELARLKQQLNQK